MPPVDVTPSYQQRVFDFQMTEQLVAHVSHHFRAGVRGFVQPVPEAHQPERVRLVLCPRHARGYILHAVGATRSESTHHKWYYTKKAVKKGVYMIGVCLWRLRCKTKKPIYQSKPHAIHRL